MQTEIKLRSH